MPQNTQPNLESKDFWRERIVQATERNGTTKYLDYLYQTYPAEASTLAKVAYCESHWKQIWNSLHPIRPDYYTAFGFFQIIAGHDKTYKLDRMDPYQNVDEAVLLYRDQGLQPWDESKGCWSK